MDKFLRKRDEEKVVPLKSGVNITSKTSKNRNYKEEYVNYGFIWTGGEEKPKPKCLVCGTVLANESMVPNKLKRHLEQSHLNVSQKPPEYFKRLRSSMQKSSAVMEKRLQLSDKALLATFKVSELIAKKQKANNIGEELILPACKEMVSVIFGLEAVEQISKIPLSNDTVHRRIVDMSADIEDNVLGKMTTKFSLQLDESTDVSGKAQLISFVRFVDGSEIIEHFLFCHELETTTTGADIFGVEHNFFQKNNLQWVDCIAICTDGAAAMTGNIKGFLSFARKENPSVVTTHCFLHREALMVKSTDGNNLGQVIKTVVSIINYIKVRPVKSRVFEKLCVDMGSDHKTLLYHTEIRWLSKGKILKRVLELKDELLAFFDEENTHPEAKNLSKPIWCAKLAYLSDIFNKLNSLNTNMQGRNETIISANGKMNAFAKKIMLWKSAVQEDDLTVFPAALNASSGLKTNEKNELKDNIINHLSDLQEGMTKYFPSMETTAWEWVISPFGVSGEENINKGTALTYAEKEQLLEVSCDTNLKSKFKDVALDTFWISIKDEYADISNKAVTVLLPFATSYLCEAAFSALKNIKSKNRSRLVDVDSEMRVCLSTIRPRIEDLCKSRQGQVSH